MPCALGFYRASGQSLVCTAGALAGLLLGAGACRSQEPTPALRPTPNVTGSGGAVAVADPSANIAPATEADLTRHARQLASSAPALDAKRYAWLEDGSTKTGERAGARLEALETLEARFPPPPGYTRVTLQPGSFGHYLRGLPMAQADAPVRTYRGDVLLEASDPRIAGVVALDIGTQDLQQCADSIVRLHAEWRHQSDPDGRTGDIAYRAMSGFTMSWARYQRGDRFVAQGNTLVWNAAAARPDTSRAGFRRFLDAVFTYSNTIAIARDGHPLTPAELAPGDFFVQGGSPGHAVLVLDVATSSDGKRRALLGQGYMPAQSFQVLRSTERAPHAAWFELDPDKPVATPFWAPFAWSSLRRM